MGTFRPRVTARAICAAILCFSLLSLATAAPKSEAEEKVSLGGKYLHAFHICPSTADCGNPQNHTVYLAQSNDGVTWKIPKKYKPTTGSVPDVVRRKNTVYMYVPGQVRTYDVSKNKWGNFSAVTITDSAGAAESYVDPNAFLDSEGRIVLFFLHAIMGQDPAGCATSESTCVKYIRSATEVAGSGGKKFLLDPGNRAEIAISRGQSASDPDLFEGPNGFVLYVSRGNSVQALQSSSLRGSFTQIAELPNGLLVNNRGGIPSGYFDSKSNLYWTYVHTTQNNATLIKVAKHASLSSSLTDADFVATITGESFPSIGAGYSIASPGFALNKTAKVSQ